MMRLLFKDKKFYFILLWLLFTTVFAIWWMILGIGHVDLLTQLLPDQAHHWLSQRRMLLFEGLSWIGLLLVGGVTSLYLLLKEKSHTENLRAFFASFNHDIKTSLASLRLQAEALKEDLNDQGSNSKVLDRLISDTMRLQVQLENSLYMNAKNNQSLWLEAKSLEKLVESARFRWPQLKIHLNQDVRLKVDEKAFVTVIDNLIQNALAHGKASQVNLNVESAEKKWIQINFYDDGRGFLGSRERLGELFFRPTSSSGTGLGLYICYELIKKMNGQFSIPEQKKERGFSVALLLEGEPS